MMTRLQKSSGFALLLTLVVVSVVLAIGLTLVEISLKQLTLSGTGRESEIAFHAAHAGAECAYRSWLAEGKNAFIGSAPNLDQCLSNSNISGVYSEPNGSGNHVHLSTYEIDWGGSGSERCTELDFYIFDADANGSDLSYNVEAYDRANDETCAFPSKCTFILSRGYNRSCADKDSGERVIQREVVLTL